MQNGAVGSIPKPEVLEVRMPDISAILNGGCIRCLS